MSTIRITKEFRFEGAHALQNYDGKCRHIHGHSYRLFVTIKGIPIQDKKSPKNGMVIDFGDLKKIVNKYIVDPFDHALLLRSDAPLREEISTSYQNVIILDFQPTCENLAIYFADLLKENLPTDTALYSIRLYETPTSYVEWIASEN
ncbi:MAG: 6-carboxytetrahydropterin synthase QueD [Bacteroidales bacterium]|jgi:6-pyruvoyltetrahydropterin/6-carboxytetrahydropterin synthase|nr:6-carboxytetrahydropterin synthase QueD [Bacteroidales bacterium]MDD4058479.1 6-carboxytetrahydropterin synthase QueD [Bacteroidales bacterium]